MYNPLSVDIFNNVPGRRASPAGSQNSNPLMTNFSKGVTQSYYGSDQVIAYQSSNPQGYTNSLRNSGINHESSQYNLHRNNRQESASPNPQVANRHSSQNINAVPDTSSFSRHFLPSNLNRGEANVLVNGRGTAERPYHPQNFASASPKHNQSRQSNEYGQVIRNQIHSSSNNYGNYGSNQKIPYTIESNPQKSHFQDNNVLKPGSNYHVFTDNYQNQTQLATMKNKLNQLTVNLAKELLEEEILCQQLKNRAVSQTTTSSNEAVGGSAQNVRHQIEAAIDNSRRLEMQISEVKKRTDANKVRRRYLLAKKIEGDACLPKNNLIKAEIVALKNIIKDNNNEKDTEKFKLISEVESQMRKKAEFEAMKAASRSQWGYNDPELSKIAQKIIQLERMVS